MKELLKEFLPGTIIHIEIVFPGQYRIGFETKDIHYVPGFGSYYPFEKAMQLAVDSYKKWLKIKEEDHANSC